MTQIVIVGSGGMAAEITLCYENTSSSFYKELSIKGYIDYPSAVEKYWKRYNYEKPVLSDIENYEVTDNEYFVLGMSDIKVRKYMIKQIELKGGRFINLIHPTAIVARNSLIGTGNIIGPFSYIGPNAQVGDFNVFLSQTIISHDCVIGDNNVFANTLICGLVKVKNDNFFGARSTVIPQVCVGSNNTIQAGMVVDKDISDETVVFHRFKEKIIVIPRDQKSDV